MKQPQTFSITLGHLDHCCHYKETRKLIGLSDQLTDFYRMTSLDDIIKTGFRTLGSWIKPFQPDVAFIKKSVIWFWTENQMTVFHMKCNTGLKWVNTQPKFHSHSTIKENENSLTSSPTANNENTLMTSLMWF